MSRRTDLNLLACSICGGKGKGLVVGLPLPYQPLHIGSVLSTLHTLLQSSRQTDVARLHIQTSNIWCSVCTCTTSLYVYTLLALDMRKHSVKRAASIHASGHMAAVCLALDINRALIQQTNSHRHVV